MRKTLLIALILVAACLIGTGFSSLYQKEDYPAGLHGTWMTSYGFPAAWHGYSWNEGPIPLFRETPTYWFSLESLLLDALFWFGISFVAYVVPMKSFRTFGRTLVSKLTVTYFSIGIYSSVVGASIWLLTYEDLGFRLFGIGLFLLVATFYQILLVRRRASQSSRLETTRL